MRLTIENFFVLVLADLGPSNSPYSCISLWKNGGGDGMTESRQTLVLEDRKSLSISGIRNVDSFDEQRIELSSVMGTIDITGAGMKIAGLDLTAGNILIQGEIDVLAYSRSKEEKSVRQKSKSALARLLK